MINWVGFSTLTYREISRFFSVWRQTIIPGLITSGLYMIIFGLTLQKRITEIDGVSYTIYILPGLIMMNVITNALNNTASSMLQMKLLQQMQDMLITPLSNFEMAIAFIIGGTVRGFINGVLVLLLGVFLVQMPVEKPILVLFLLFIVSWAFSSAGLLVGILSETWDNIATILNFFVTPLIFLGGVFYSIDMLPSFWREISLINPIYYVINGLRYSILNIGDTSFSISIIITIFMTILFTSISIWLFKIGYRIKN
tara:strand:+ start:2103 stop:2867 length:765 start_codon:yes stop_codon:yes gene_type:complete